MTNTADQWLQCVSCDAKYPLDQIIYACECGHLLEVSRSQKLFDSINPAILDERLKSLKVTDRSGVWRFRECILDIPESEMVAHPEGRTNLYQRASLAKYGGVTEIYFKHEGENPTGSFKDRGMTVAVTQAKRLGAKAIICASTGNTSAALAAYAAHAGLKAIVILPAAKVALGKISQAIGYGATCLAVRGDFDDAMKIVQESVSKLGLYMVNSLNPFRPEGQKSIMWETMQDLGWNAPDWIVVPGGNLGNTSAFGKALLEAKAAGWINKVPRIATIQAQGANPFYQSYLKDFSQLETMKASTVATAIQIGNPVNFEKAVKVIRNTNGVVEQVTDEELMLAKAQIDASGLGCEPASACTLAGVRKLVKAGTIKSSDRVVCVLTGNILKDPDAILSRVKDSIHEIEAKLSEVERYL